ALESRNSRMDATAASVGMEARLVRRFMSSRFDDAVSVAARNALRLSCKMSGAFAVILLFWSGALAVGARMVEFVAGESVSALTGVIWADGILLAFGPRCSIHTISRASEITVPEIINKRLGFSFCGRITTFV